MEYPWYENIKQSRSIFQGDLIPNCPILQPPTNIETIREISIDEYNTVVLSQSCDLENSKIEIVLVCPYYELSYFLSVHPDSKNGGKGIDKTINNLLQGNYPSYHILNKNEEIGLSDYIVVDFRNVYGVNYGFLISHVENIESRIRLLPPYREHLSQAFARYFMRVGLPINIELNKK
jgi:hypothetical protein